MESIDKNLTEGIMNGDRNAITELHKRFSRSMLLYAFKILKDKELANDVVQDVFVKIIQNKVSITSSVKGFLMTAVYHQAIDEIRKGKRSKNTGNQSSESKDSDIDQPENESISLFNKYTEVSDWNSGIENLMINDCKRFFASRLTPAQLQIIDLDNQGFSIDDIVEELNSRGKSIARNTVRTHLYFGRQVIELAKKEIMGALV
jgi:RNA polymerase sigma-70 factor (ECF subfamily)